MVGRTDHRAFWTFPYVLYQGDPHWVPPLRYQESRRWSPAMNPSLAKRQVRRFLARRDGRVVGRVAAIHDPAFSERWAPGAGFFGFFESEDHQPTADSLLVAVAETVREWGLTKVLGPVNLSTNDEVGLLVAGFDDPPMLLSPYNPPYYQRLLEKAGLVVERDYHAYAWDPMVRAAAVERAVQAAAQSHPPLTLRSVDPNNWNSEVKLLHRMYDACFADLWGFVPLTSGEFTQRASEFRPFYRPELALFAERQGETIGFTLALPDINEVLARVGGRLLPFGWLTLLRGVSRIRSARAILMGVLPQYRKGGAAMLLAAGLINAARRIGFTRAEISLIQQTNAGMGGVIRGVGGRPIKSYRLYQQSLGP